MVCFSFLHYTSLCISCDKNLGEFLMLCFVLWALCCSFLSIKVYVCTWVDLLFVNNFDPFITFYLQMNVNFCSMLKTNTHLRTRMIRTSMGLFLALMEFKGRLFNYLGNLMRMNCIGEGMWKGKKNEGNRCHLQSNLRLVEVLHPHLHLSHLSSDWSHHGRIRPFRDLMGPKMMEFVEFSMKLPSKIRGENSLSKVSNFLFLWT